MATNNPEALLDRLCEESSESAWVEFKVNNADPDMIGTWISAAANAAILAEKDRAFLVFGVEDASRKKVGSNIRLSKIKKGGENIENWLARMLDPHLSLEF